MPPVRDEFVVVAEGPDWIVVDKPAPLMVHPTRLDGEPTLYHGLRAYLCYEIANGGQVSIITRLDRETTGLVLVATTRGAARRLGKAMAAREVKKRYEALVHGWPGEDRFEVDAPLRDRRDYEDSPVAVMVGVDVGGAEARTRFGVRRRFERGGESYAWLEVWPETGRKHQIRAHLAHVGHPIVGDKLYRDPSIYLRMVEAGGVTAELASELVMSRQALHASGLWVGELGWEIGLAEDLGEFLGEVREGDCQ
jgi:23S rRNA pseudouridine1911/1915/1917 synthase